MMRSLAGVAARRRASSLVRPLSSGAGIDVSALTVTRSEACRSPPENAALKGQFGKIFSDHMFVCDHVKGAGWGAPRVVPHAPLALSPAAMTLH